MISKNKERKVEIRENTLRLIIAMLNDLGTNASFLLATCLEAKLETKNEHIN